MRPRVPIVAVSCLIVVIGLATTSPAQEPAAPLPALPEAVPVPANEGAPLPPAIVATPVPEGGQEAPDAPSDDPQSPSPTMIATPTDLVPAAVNTVIPPNPTGATISQMQSNSRVIEDFAPERVPVYPEDPESAWWEINPRYAFKRAQREQRPLMLLFTGVWNTQAMALSQEVFATKSFNDYVKENLVICYLDYPRNYTDAPDALRQIKDKFKVKGYPNVLIFNLNGEVERGIRGYRTGRPVDYFNQLVAACTPVLASIEAQKAELITRGYRDWSNYLGQVFFAKLIEHDTQQVVLEDAARQKWAVKINDLAPDDQRMVESFPPVTTLSWRD